MKKVKENSIYTPEKKAIEDKRKSRRFLGGFVIMFYFMAVYEYLYSLPEKHSRSSFLFLREIFGPHAFLILFICFGTFCLLLMLINEKD